MQEYGECQAEFYYNKNYGHKERMKKKEKDKKGLDDMNHQKNEESYESDNASNVDNIATFLIPNIYKHITYIKNIPNVSKALPNNG